MTYVKWEERGWVDWGTDSCVIFPLHIIIQRIKKYLMKRVLTKDRNLKVQDSKRYGHCPHSLAKDHSGGGPSPPPPPPPRPGGGGGGGGGTHPPPPPPPLSVSLVGERGKKANPPPPTPKKVWTFEVFWCSLVAFGNRIS